MILDRTGKKSPDIVERIIRYFKPHDVFYDVFFGAGGLFFQKPTSRYNIVNDMDGDVINLWEIMSHEKSAAKLEDLFRRMPLHEELFAKWLKAKPKSSMHRAVRFLMLSNFSLYGKCNTFHLLHSNIARKASILELFPLVTERLERCIFRQKDFREFFKDFHISDKHIPAKNRFIYADPPYVGRTNTYNTPAWKDSDLADLVDVLDATGTPYAISEFSGKFVNKLAERRNLTVVELCDRMTMKKSERTEVLLLNYPIPIGKQMAFDEQFLNQFTVQNFGANPHTPCLQES